MSDHNTDDDSAEQDGEQIYTEVMSELDNLVIGAFSYIYEDEDGDYQPVTARISLEPDDAPIQDHFRTQMLINLGLKQLLDDSAVGQMLQGGDTPNDAQVVAMSAEEAEEAGILDALMEHATMTSNTPPDSKTDADDDSADDSRSRSMFE